MKIRFVFTFLILLFLLFAYGCNNESQNFAISNDGVEISFESRGKGKPAIIFVHGWTNPRTIWDEQLELFSVTYQSVAIDLAGSGESGNNRSQWTVKAFSDDVVAVINKLQLDEVVLVGFSMGASVVLETANQIPNKVKGVVIVDHLQNPEMKLPSQMVPVMDSIMMDLINDMTKEKLISMGFFKNDKDKIYERVMKLYPDDVSKIGWRESLNENMKWMNEDCIPLLTNIPVPIHAINSDMQPTEVEIFRKYVPGFKAKIIKDVGHLVFWEKPAEFQKLLEESIKEFID